MNRQKPWDVIMNGKPTVYNYNNNQARPIYKFGGPSAVDQYVPEIADRKPDPSTLSKSNKASKSAVRKRKPVKREAETGPTHIEVTTTKRTTKTTTEKKVVNINAEKKAKKAQSKTKKAKAPEEVVPDIDRKGQVSNPASQARKRKGQEAAKDQKRKKGVVIPQALNELSSTTQLMMYAKSDIPQNEILASNSPHLLLRRAEFEIRRNEKKEARKALDEALKCITKQTHPSSDDLLRLSNDCEFRKNYLRASFFKMASAYRKSKDSDAEYDKCFFTSERIYETKKLVHKIKTSDPDVAMNGGTPLEIAQFVTSFLNKMYNVGCAKDKTYVRSESRKGYALFWTAVAYLDVMQYRQSKTYAEKGIMEIETNMSREEREYLQTYVRLLKLSSEACWKLGEYTNASAFSTQALRLIDGATYQTEEQRYEDKRRLITINENAEIKLLGSCY